MGSKFRNRFESLSSALKIRPRTREEQRIMEVYRESLDRNFRDVPKDREVRDWLAKPFQLDFSIDTKKAEQTRSDKLREIFADLDEDQLGGAGSHQGKQPIDLNQYEDDFERLAFSRRHANYGAVGKSITEMKRFINAKMHQAKLKQLSTERYAQLKKIDCEKVTFEKKQTNRGFILPRSKSIVSVDDETNFESFNRGRSVSERSSLRPPDRQSVMFGRKSTIRSAFAGGGGGGGSDRARTTDRIRFKLDESPNQNENEDNLFWENRYQYRPSMMNVRFSTTSILSKKPKQSKRPSSVQDPRFLELSDQLNAAYLVDKVKDINEIINNNTALKRINELKQIEEDKQNKKRELINYARKALKSDDYIR